jgi:pimeloyl-ACP methyl ester carboxylesterase
VIIGLQTLPWIWRGQAISTVCSPALSGLPDRGAVLLVHGFGASWRHWRHTIPALSAAGFRVHALDLLGFGASAKPPSNLPGDTPLESAVNYGFDLWAEQVVDYCSARIGPGPVGGAALRPGRRRRGLVLIDKAGRFGCHPVTGPGAGAGQDGRPGGQRNLYPPVH